MTTRRIINFKVQLNDHEKHILEILDFLGYDTKIEINYV